MNAKRWMKAWQVTAVFAALLILPLFAPAAHADGLSLGASFRIGGIHFNLTFGDFGYGHPRGYYYRTDDAISYGQTRCNSYCLDRGGHHYHHESCPLVRRHLAAFNIDPFRLFDRYAPGYRDRYDNDYGDRYDERYDEGYNRYDGYDRSDRYDNYPYRDPGHGYSQDRRSRDRGYGRRYDDRHHRRQAPPACPRR